MPVSRQCESNSKWNWSRLYSDCNKSDRKSLIHVHGLALVAVNGHKSQGRACEWVGSCKGTLSDRIGHKLVFIGVTDYTTNPNLYWTHSMYLVDVAMFVVQIQIRVRWVSVKCCYSSEKILLWQLWATPEAVWYGASWVPRNALENRARLGMERTTCGGVGLSRIGDIVNFIPCKQCKNTNFQNVCVLFAKLVRCDKLD